MYVCRLFNMQPIKVHKPLNSQEYRYLKRQYTSLFAAKSLSTSMNLTSYGQNFVTSQDKTFSINSNRTKPSSFRCSASAKANNASSALASKTAGSWPSPITSLLLVTDSLRLGDPIVEEGEIFWLEGRPQEKGRQVLCKRKSDGSIQDITPSGDAWNVRTRVHEYGGGDFLIFEGYVYFSNFSDQRLYKQPTSGASDPVPLTPEGCDLRFADAAPDTLRRRLVCVCEDHSAGGKEPQNKIVAIDMNPPEDPTTLKQPVTLAEGADFYSSPRVSPDGGALAWVQWDHPAMPWDHTHLLTAPINQQGLLESSRVVTSDNGSPESVSQPLWSPAGVLHFISDRASGWWNIHREGKDGVLEVVRAAEVEHAPPAWQLGKASYRFLPSGDILCVFGDPKKSGSSLAVVRADTGETTELATPFTHFGSLSVSVSGEDVTVATLAGSSVKPTAVVVSKFSTSEAMEWTEVQVASKMSVDEEYLSTPQAMEYPTVNGRTAHMLYYPPKNKECNLGPEETPPLLVKSHGGPTASTSAAFNPAIQFWTSRGWAVADVDYGGSTGYGREYRDTLKGNWGVVDVADVSGAAKHLTSLGLADERRLCIDGQSAGGYTTLACLAFDTTFKAGASLYGIGDLEVLAGDTHKFESRYLDSLIGRYPEDAEVYKARSPINSVDKLKCPVILFQGEEDKVVPPAQAQMMYDALLVKGIPTALCLFPGEQHGFRQSVNIRRCLEGELFFFCKVFGMPCSMPDDVEPIEIANIDAIEK